MENTAKGPSKSWKTTGDVLTEPRVSVPLLLVDPGVVVGGDGAAFVTPL